MKNLNIFKKKRIIEIPKGGTEAIKYLMRLSNKLKK